MRAAYITGRESLELREQELPAPGPDQVRVRVEHVGICGSDLHYHRHGENSGFVVREPLIPGHELSGSVDLDPAGRWRHGQAITVHPARRGPRQPDWPDQPHLWPGGSYLGSASTWPHTQGAMAEYIVVDSTMLRALPAGLSTRTAVLAEPLAVALHGVRVAGGVRGARVLVAGSGPIGLLAVAAARNAGALAVTATDVRTGPLERARQLGADKAVDVTQEDVPPNSCDVVLECSGALASISAALDAVCPGGTVIQVGMVPPESPGPPLTPLITKELTLRGAFRFIDELDDAVSLLAADEQIAAVITHQFSLDEVQAAFSAASDPQASGKVLVSPHIEATAS